VRGRQDVDATREQTLTGAPDDPEAFAQWVLPLTRPIAYLAARLAPQVERDDLVQEVFARAWAKRHQYDPARGTPSAWVLAITADLAGKARRRFRPSAPLAEVPDAVDASIAPHDIDLARALARLTERQRLAVDCHYFAGLSIAGTAAVMGCAEGTVKSTLADARSRLRTLLEVSE
jgi:RNA polymerase sigma factor (sigma-70 family)